MDGRLTSKRRWCAALAGLAFVIVARSEPAPASQPSSRMTAGPDTYCATEGSIRYICGVPKAEDIMAVPGSHWIVTTSLEGGLYLIDARTKIPFRVFPNEGSRVRFDHQTFADCPPAPGPDELAHFNTLGIELRPGKPGVHRIYVTRYPGESRIDVLELDVRRTPTATWIGCVPAPDRVLANAVVALPGNAMITTSFYESGPNSLQSRARAEAGEVTGDAWLWRAGQGWRKLPGTESSGTNGIVASRDRRTLYISQWGSQTFLRVNLTARPIRKDVIMLGFRPDNVHWAPDGQLLVAGHTATTGHVVKIDPRSLAVTQLLTRTDTPEFLHMSGALQIGNELWIASSRSRRIAVVPLSPRTGLPLP